MSRIGLVAEGPRDYDMFEAVIDRLTHTENEYLYLQPESELGNENGNGWRGVWKWCRSHRNYLRDYLNSIHPKLDLLIIQMDGDVSRKEQQSHCGCQRSNCVMELNVHPLRCPRFDDGKCPVYLPCDTHKAVPEAFANHLHQLLEDEMGDINELPIVFVFPVDSTDTWIVAAYEDDEYFRDIGAEMIVDPWLNVITHSLEYHNVRRASGGKKARKVYRALIPKVCVNWDIVEQRCSQAALFSKKLKEVLQLENVS